MSDTVFHKIIRGELPADILYQDELVVAFRDISPAAPSHVLIVPRKDLPCVSDVTEDDRILVGHMVFVARNLATSLEIAAEGYRLVFNCGDNGGQVVPQLHLHLLGGRKLSWPPG